jgi:hypothetical protein
MNLGWFVRESLGQCAGSHNGQSWVRMRKIFDATFTHSASVPRIETVDAVAKAYVEKLPKLAARLCVQRSGRDGESFLLSVTESFTRFTYFLTACVIYGAMTEAEEHDLWCIMQNWAALTPYFFTGRPYRFATATWFFDRTAIIRLRAFEREWTAFHRALCISGAQRRQDRWLLRTGRSLRMGTSICPR